MGVELDDLPGRARDDDLLHAARATFHVRRKRVDADAGPAHILERLGIRPDGSVTGADIEKESIRDAREHLADDPFVLTDFRRIGHAPDGFPRRHPQRLKDTEIAALAIERELFASFNAAWTNRHDSDGSDDENDHGDASNHFSDPERLY